MRRPLRGRRGANEDREWGIRPCGGGRAVGARRSVSLAAKAVPRRWVRTAAPTRSERWGRRAPSCCGRRAVPAGRMRCLVLSFIINTLTLYSIACAYRPPPLGMAHTPSLPAMTAGERDGDSVTGKPVSLTEKPWKCSSFGGEVSFHNRHIALSELPVQLRGERKLQALVSELIH